ncbi:MAG: preprotein translocase subunit SecG [Planctomycetota bacterium]
MNTLVVLLYLLFVATAIVLTVVILLQEGKGGGFGDALGSAGQQAFGVKASGVQKFTMWIAIVFLASAVLIHILNKRASGFDLGSAPRVIETQPFETQPAPFQAPELF